MGCTAPLQNWVSTQLYIIIESIVCLMAYRQLSQRFYSAVNTVQQETPTAN